jgi:hypothetical protein
MAASFVVAATRGTEIAAYPFKSSRAMTIR